MLQQSIQINPSIISIDTHYMSSTSISVKKSIVFYKNTPRILRYVQPGWVDSIVFIVNVYVDNLLFHYINLLRFLHEHRQIN